MHIDTAVSSLTIADLGLISALRDSYRATFSMNFDSVDGSAFVAEWLTHSAVMCSRA